MRWYSHSEDSHKTAAAAGLRELVQEEPLALALSVG